MISWLFVFIIGSSALFFLIFVISLVYKKKLSERESVIWVTVAILAMILCLFPSLFDWLSRLMHIHYSASLYFFFSIIFILAILVRNSCHTTKHQKQIKTLAQKITFLEDQIRNSNGK